MNCTQTEFEQKVYSVYPHKHKNLDIDPQTNDRTIFALDTMAECKHSYPEKFRLADFVWCNGSVVKDAKNLFAQTAIVVPSPQNGQTNIGNSSSNNSFFCTQTEFEQIVCCLYPHKCMGLDFDSSGRKTIFVLDTVAQLQYPYMHKYNLSDTIWREGSVIYDSNNIFISNNSIRTVTIPLPSHATLNNNAWIPNTSATGIPANNVSDNFQQPFVYNTSKCVCGAHKTGSNMHSAWCEVKNV